MNNFNIAFVGTISAGKTTLLNALSTEAIGDVHTKKTTLVPNVFHEVIVDDDDDDTKIDSLSHILENTNKKNVEFLKMLETNTFERLEEVHYNIKRINDFIVYEKNISVTLYDIPGLN